MKPIPFITFVLLSQFFALHATASTLEIDHEANQTIRAKPLFNKTDTTNDWKLTKEDGLSESELTKLDANKDGQVTFQEFAQNSEIPYPQWNGAVTRNIVYKRKDGRTLLMDVYRKSANVTTPQPVLYFVHGGGWSGGVKEPNYQMNLVFKEAVDLGFTCIAVNYRLVMSWNQNDPVVMRDCVIDVKDGLRFIKKNADELNVDPDRVIVIGFSAGGHLAQMLNYTEPDDFIGDDSLAQYTVKPIGGISWYGPSDFTEDRLFESDATVQLKFKQGTWQKLVEKNLNTLTYATASDQQKALLTEMSPTEYVDANDPPMLALHGTNDPVISFHHLGHLKTVANSHGASVETIEVENANHGWYGNNLSPSWPELLNRMSDFLETSIQ